MTFITGKVTGGLLYTSEHK